MSYESEFDHSNVCKVYSESFDHISEMLDKIHDKQISKREYFAAAVLQGFASNTKYFGPKEEEFYTRHAVQWADTLIQKLEEKK